MGRLLSAGTFRARSKSGSRCHRMPPTRDRRTVPTRAESHGSARSLSTTRSFLRPFRAPGAAECVCRPALRDTRALSLERGGTRRAGVRRPIGRITGEKRHTRPLVSHVPPPSNAHASGGEHQTHPPPPARHATIPNTALPHRPNRMHRFHELCARERRVRSPVTVAVALARTLLGTIVAASANTRPPTCNTPRQLSPTL